MTAAKERQPIPFATYLLLDRLSLSRSFEVWLATAPGVKGRKPLVAIKRVLPHLAKSSAFVTSFMDDARLAIRLNHPNIAQHFDVGHVDGSCFIAMEYVSGMALAKVIERGPKKGAPMPIALASTDEVMERVKDLERKWNV